MVECSAFHMPTRCPAAPVTRNLRGVVCCEEPPEQMTKVGSKAYYQGFLTQPVDENVTRERGDGTEQAVKFAASSFVVISFLLLGFMASNGLI